MTQRPATFFTSPALWRAWLLEHHGQHSELWVGFRKRHTGQPSMTWPESVDEALCFGWIDGIRQRIDDNSYRIRFTPRKAGSTWSTVNLARIAELERAGLVQPAGLAAHARRKEARVGVYAYESSERILPDDYEALLRADAAASAYWDARPPSYRRTAAHWVLSAERQETRDRRMAQLVADSAAGHFVAPMRWAKGADVPGSDG